MGWILHSGKQRFRELKVFPLDHAAKKEISLRPWVSGLQSLTQCLVQSRPSPCSLHRVARESAAQLGCTWDLGPETAA